MQRKSVSHKLSYFSSWHLLAKLLSLLISVYILFAVVSCRQNSPEQVFNPQNRHKISESAVNINTATAEELEKLPRIGTETAREIIEHRKKYGAFGRPEDLILVRGMSDKKFREIRSLVKVE
jgi:competence ComEA-like helix-hairpin-helix protein